MDAKIWIGVIEIGWKGEEAGAAWEPAFTVVTTWADSPQEYREKCSRMLKSHGWYLIDVDNCRVAEMDSDYSEEVADMLERTRSNPNAIIYGTFHSYPVM